METYVLNFNSCFDESSFQTGVVTCNLKCLEFFGQDFPSGNIYSTEVLIDPSLRYLRTFLKPNISKTSLKFRLAAYSETKQAKCLRDFHLSHRNKYTKYSWSHFEDYFNHLCDKSKLFIWEKFMRSISFMTNLVTLTVTEKELRSLESSNSQFLEKLFGHKDQKNSGGGRRSETGPNGSFLNEEPIPIEDFLAGFEEKHQDQIENNEEAEPVLDQGHIQGSQFEEGDCGGDGALGSRLSFQGTMPIILWKCRASKSFVDFDYSQLNKMEESVFINVKKNHLNKMKKKYENYLGSIGRNAKERSFKSAELV